MTEEHFKNFVSRKLNVHEDVDPTIITYTTTSYKQKVLNGDLSSKGRMYPPLILETEEMSRVIKVKGLFVFSEELDVALREMHINAVSEVVSMIKSIDREIPRVWSNNQWSLLILEK